VATGAFLVLNDPKNAADFDEVVEDSVESLSLKDLEAYMADLQARDFLTSKEKECVRIYERLKGLDSIGEDVGKIREELADCLKGI